MSAEAPGTLATSGMPRIRAAEFLRARDFLLANSSNYAEAYERFRWPALEHFNWAFDYFDAMAANNSEPALIIDNEDGPYQSFSFAAMSERSNQAANFFRQLGVRRGERILVMLGNEVPLWESMLAACKLGAVIMPTSLAISTDDLNDRLERGQARYVVANLACKEKFRSCAAYTRIVVGGTAEGWVEYEQAYAEAKQFAPEVPPEGVDPFLLYFTSGTTAKPKLVMHSQHSYPVGHLSTMYWIGIKPGDLHWNISSPGLEFVLRSVERRGMHSCIERYAVQRFQDTREIDTFWCHYPLCPAYCLENARQRELTRIRREIARSSQRGRTTKPGGRAAGRAQLGPNDQRRIWTDGVYCNRREYAWPEG